MHFIDLKKQYELIESEVLDSIRNVLNHGQYIMGPEIGELEKKLADFVGVRHAIVNASGTDALLMALLALEVKAGDEVITTPFSFFATAEVILLLGAKPVFVDIDASTYNIDVSKIEAAITPNTKAILPVNLFGQCADLIEINHIAKKYGLPVVEDAAQSFGARHEGFLSCGLGTIGCTSFFPSKPLGGYGDSGACFTEDDILAERLREIRIHGQNGRYSHCRLGINGRMDTLQAAILLEKMKLFPREVQLREEIGKNYSKLLKNCVKTPFIKPENRSVFAQYTIEVDHRDAFQKNMQALAVPTAVHYPSALHLQEAVKHLGYKKGDFPFAEAASQRVVSLPMHPYLSQEDMQFIVKATESSIKSLVDIA